MKVIFFGTPQFSAEIFSYLIERHIHIVAVVTQPSRPQGRSLKLGDPPVKTMQEKIAPHLPLFQPLKVSTDEYEKILKAFDADLFIVVAYGEILKPAILSLPRLGCINVHTSLLPHLRGAAPIQRALMNGDMETGVTIMHMAQKMDAGDIIEQVKVPIDAEMTSGMLTELLCEKAAPLLLKVVKSIEKGEISSSPQNPHLATFAPKITHEDTEIIWDRSAEEIHNKIRALNPHPGAWCTVSIGSELKRLKIHRSTLQYEKLGYELKCGNGTLTLLEVQLEGKKKMNASEFFRGHPDLKFN